MSRPGVRPLAIGATVLVLVAASCANGGRHDGRPSGSGGGCTRRTFGDSVQGVSRVVRVHVPCPDQRAEVRTTRSIPGETLVTVAPNAGRSGEAAVDFGSRDRCDLIQIQPGKIARLRIRYPEGALFRLYSGKAYCSFFLNHPFICGTATVEATGESDQTFAQARLECTRDPVMNIAVYSGSMHIELATGRSFDVGANDEMSQFPVPGIGHAEFAPEEVARFEVQAQILGLETGGTTATPTPTGAAPVNEEPPTVRWVETFRTVAAATGSWIGADPEAFTYQWLVACSSTGEGCVPAEGETGVEYQPHYPDDCDYIAVIVTASNEHGSTPAVSDPFGINCVG